LLTLDDKVSFIDVKTNIN